MNNRYIEMLRDIETLRKQEPNSINFYLNMAASALMGVIENPVGVMENPYESTREQRLALLLFSQDMLNEAIYNLKEME